MLCTLWPFTPKQSSVFPEKENIPLHTKSTVTNFSKFNMKIGLNLLSTFQSCQFIFPETSSPARFSLSTRCRAHTAFTHCSSAVSLDLAQFPSLFLSCMTLVFFKTTANGPFFIAPLFHMKNLCQRLSLLKL